MQILYHSDGYQRGRLLLSMRAIVRQRKCQCRFDIVESESNATSLTPGVSFDWRNVMIAIWDLNDNSRGRLCNILMPSSNQDSIIHLQDSILTGRSSNMIAFATMFPGRESRITNRQNSFNTNFASRVRSRAICTSKPSTTSWYYT